MPGPTLCTQISAGHPSIPTCATEGPECSQPPAFFCSAPRRCHHAQLFRLGLAPCGHESPWRSCLHRVTWAPRMKPKGPGITCSDGATRKEQRPQGRPRTPPPLPRLNSVQNVPAWPVSTRGHPSLEQPQTQGNVLRILCTLVKKVGAFPLDIL